MRRSAGVATRVFSPQTAPQKEETNLLDMALNAVLSLFKDQQQQSARCVGVQDIVFAVAGFASLSPSRSRV